MDSLILTEFYQKIKKRNVKDPPELHYYIMSDGPLSAHALKTIDWVLKETYKPEWLAYTSFIPKNRKGRKIVEIGTLLERTTPWSSNFINTLRMCDIHNVIRVEKFRRYSLPKKADINAFFLAHGDRATETYYLEDLTSFNTGRIKEPVIDVRFIEDGKPALEKINIEMGLGLDEWDINYYYNLFVNVIGRNPTNVECFDLSQSNSEHSRHWFFNGILEIDGEVMPKSLMQMIREPLKVNIRNSVIAFKDNSSAIRGALGAKIMMIMPVKPGSMSLYHKEKVEYHIIFTAETHNFPSGVAPFPGAETGTGGRLRDIQATGRGALVIAGTAGYCVGNLRIPGYNLPWEDGTFMYPSNLATPLMIEIEASNGASDYGNKFGEPVIQGFTRSFGLRMPDGERREWLKPIMFTAGVGQLDSRHVEKEKPQKGMLVTKVGGPEYRIGMGGGAASSMISGVNTSELDQDAVQRGDAEMEQKMNRVIRACVQMGDKNPIIIIHDRGAGGNCNVIKEIIYPAGARIELKEMLLGDETLSVLEIWGNESQEQNALVIKPESREDFLKICEREGVPCVFIGEITEDGYVVLHDETDGTTPVNLKLDLILGDDMPRKKFVMESRKRVLNPLELPTDLTVRGALDRVLRLVSVCSKRFLTDKVDRSVGGLIARQQCVGPLQLTVSDVAVVAQSYLEICGAAISIGEQPIKGLIDSAAMARMSVGEAIINMVWAGISCIENIKCSGNWMWAPKLPGEGAEMYKAVEAMVKIMIDLGIAIDGGKDSLYMAAKAAKDAIGKIMETVKSPGALVVSAYCDCPDITNVITPDIKRPGESRLIYIDLGNGKYRLGGSAIAQCWMQVGDETPDVENPKQLKDAFNVIQLLMKEGLILSGHDRSDGGLATTLLEMGFAGNCGFRVNINSPKDSISTLFAEELGMVIEYLSENEQEITSLFDSLSLPYQIIGGTRKDKSVTFEVNGQLALREDMCVLRDLWEETSFKLGELQRKPAIIRSQRKNLYDRPGMDFKLTYEPKPTSIDIFNMIDKPKVAVIRMEGSNGDQEMVGAFMEAGFEVYDVTMKDFIDGLVDLGLFRGIAFVGGFSVADVPESGKGWAAVIRSNRRIWDMFQKFYHRPDTFSLSVCNGCQLAALLGWLPWQGIDEIEQPRFIHNNSGGFDSRFISLKIIESPAIALRGMAGSVIGMWSAHGEGKAFFPNDQIRKQVLRDHLAPFRYADDYGRVTGKYPFNPNGSPNGIAALCSPDGRHLAMMPHPERGFLKWQWGWMPEEWKKNLAVSPMLQMFQNLRIWCQETINV